MLTFMVYSFRSCMHNELLGHEAVVQAYLQAGGQQTGVEQDQVYAEVMNAYI